MKHLRQHLLSLFFLVLFLGTLVAESFAGLASYNEEQLTHGSQALTWATYVTSSDFLVDVSENWQSEFLQFSVFILATIWLVQRGSPESKQPGDEGPGTDQQAMVGRWSRPDSPRWAIVGGWRRTLYSNSLLIVMTLIFVLSWLTQGITGTVAYNSEQAEHGQAPLTVAQYFVSADFWDRTLQNWQSEFLAVGSMVVLSIYLRQRGSAESKPVGMPHDKTSGENE